MLSRYGCTHKAFCIMVCAACHFLSGTQPPAAADAAPWACHNLNMVSTAMTHHHLQLLPQSYCCAGAKRPAALCPTCTLAAHEHIPPELLKKERLHYAQERSNARVAHKMRYIQIPTTHKHNQHPHLQQNRKRGDSRACHLIHNRKGTLHRSQVKQKNRDDQARAKRLDAAFSSPTIGPTAPPPHQIKSCDVVLEQVEQLCARCQLRHAMTSVKRPAHPLVRVERAGGRRQGCFAGHYAADSDKSRSLCHCPRAEGNSEHGVNRHVKGGRDMLRTCLHQSQ